MAKIQLKDGRILEIKGEATPEKIQQLLKTVAPTRTLGQSKTSALDKVIGPGGAVESTLGRASNFLFGTAGRTIGTFFGARAEGAMNKPGIFTEAERRRTGGQTAADIAFTGLEMIPGGALARTAVGQKVLSPISKKLTESATKQLAKALAPTTKKLKAQAEKVIPGMLERRISFWSTKQLGAKASAKSEDAARAIDEAIKALPEDTKLNAGLIIKTLKDLKGKYRVGNIDVNKTAIQQLDELIEITKNVAPKGQISPASLRQLRKIWDEHYDISKGLDDISGYKKKAERAAADAIRKIVADETPDVAKLNAEYSFWRGVSDVAEATTERKIGQQEFAKTVGRGLATTAGGVTFGLPGFLIGMATTVMASPKWRSVSAVVKQSLADKLAKGDMRAATRLLVSTARNLGIELVAEAYR